MSRLAAAAVKPKRERGALPPTLNLRPGLHIVPNAVVSPRIAPPRPRRSLVADLGLVAATIGRPLLAWQELAGRYIMAVRKGAWQFEEVCVVVARQNGKSAILVPRIIEGLLRGESIMHTAQNRTLPTEVFRLVVGLMHEHYPEHVKQTRLANGAESIAMKNGGVYRVVASNTMGARGYSNDLVIVDELLAMTDFDFVASARPTLAASRSRRGSLGGQMLYISNAGDEASVVLNALRERASSDDRLAYLEWSADPDRAPDDTAGWAQANPALGTLIDMETLATAYRQLPLERFETEHLCRWVRTMLPRVVSDVAWDRARAVVGQPDRPAMGIACDPRLRRASAVIAWPSDDGIVNVYPLADFDGMPVDLEAVGARITDEARRRSIREIAFDPWSDRDLARFVDAAQPMTSATWEAASLRFAEAVQSGRLRYEDPDGVLTRDIPYTVQDRTAHGWKAIAASGEERATTASLAAIRAVWLASEPRRTMRVW